MQSGYLCLSMSVALISRKPRELQKQQQLLGYWLTQLQIHGRFELLSPEGEQVFAYVRAGSSSDSSAEVVKYDCPNYQPGTALAITGSNAAIAKEGGFIVQPYSKSVCSAVESKDRTLM